MTVSLAESDPSAGRTPAARFHRDDRFGRVSHVATGDDAVRAREEVDLMIVDLRSVTGRGRQR